MEGEGGGAVSGVFSCALYNGNFYAFGIHWFLKELHHPFARGVIACPYICALTECKENAPSGLMVSLDALEVRPCAFTCIIFRSCILSLCRCTVQC